MTRKPFLLRSGVGLLAMSLTVTSGLAQDAKSPAKTGETADQIAEPLTREDRAQALHSIRDILATMEDTGEEKVFSITPDGDAGAGPAAPQPMGAPRAPGSSQDVSGLARYLDQALRRSHNQSFRNGYDILMEGLNGAFRIGRMPVAIEASLRAAQEGAQSADSYKDGWRMMYNAMQYVSQHANDFVSGKWSAFRSVLECARVSSHQLSFKNAYGVLQKFMGRLLRARELHGDPLYALAIQAADEAAGQADTYKDGWGHMYQTIQSLAGSNPREAVRSYAQAALKSSYEKSWKNGYNALMAFARKLQSSGVLDPYARESLRSAIRAADSSRTYADGYRTLKSAFQSLS